MNVEQFRLFLKAHIDGQTHAAGQLEGQTRQLKENAERNRAEQQAKRVTGCDGSSTRRLRQWFLDVELTMPYTDRTVYVATQTAQGPLRHELERHLSSLNNRAAAQWEELKAHLTTTFLSKHEGDRLRDEVEKVTQGVYETTAAYGRRFREAADLGYPKDSRNTDQQRLMLGAYFRGLKAKKLVERLIREARPQNYVDAMDHLARYEADEYQLYRVLNGCAPEESMDEPMEIGAMGSAKENKPRE